ncbi:hypothetical protein [Ilumatobacter sp.]|uniref:hypothetical protein n=1 Tax=Ilumatobacter sp. TaxID=1967498 RepID=UPI0037528FE8
MDDVEVSAALTEDERAAARAFVARCEVRLSTFHRIAVGLLSGAGLLVVLPVVARDSITGILRSLVAGDFTVPDGLLIVMVFAILGVPGFALWLLFADLTRFYFHANHLGNGRETFTPRFTLTSLRLPADELGPNATQQLDRARHEPRIVELLVPTNDASRARIDRQLDVYRATRERGGRDDHGRAEGLFELAASHPRPLLEEVAKIEYGMVRHGLRLRSIVLRYVKAVLAVLVAAVAVYSGDAVVVGLDPTAGVTVADAAWLAAIGLIWAPVVVLGITSPVRWIEQLMRDDGAATTAVANDPELTHVERVALPIAAVGWVAGAAAMIVAALDADLSTSGRVTGLAVLAISTLAVGIAASTGRFRSLLAR